jgi:ribosomal protein L7/L12
LLDEYLPFRMMQPVISPEVRAAWDSGDKIRAIRLLREETSLGLAEAKALLESNAAGMQAASVSRGQPLPPEVRAELARGNKIEAIKLLRKASGLGLKEAKELVDGAESATPSMQPGRSTGLMRGEAPGGKVRTFFVVLVVLVLGAALWMMFT